LIDRSDVIGVAHGIPGEQWRPEVIADEWQIEMIIDCGAAMRGARARQSWRAPARVLIAAVRSLQKEPTSTLTTWLPLHDC